MTKISSPNDVATDDDSDTGNDGRRAARGRMSAAGADNVASWMEFFRRPIDQGGMGYTDEQARGQIVMMQGESGLNLDPASQGDHNRAGVPQSFGTVQWNRAAGRFGKPQALDSAWARTGPIAASSSRCTAVR